MDSPIGPLTLLISNRGARSIQFGRAPVPTDAPASAGATAELAQQLQAYFSGSLQNFDYPLDWVGTPFQQRVWKALLDIPYGATASYAQVARAVGRPKACRAVGGANRRNPLPIVVPCHRVIGSDGALVGYAGRSGLGIKVRLLALEKALQPSALAS